MSLDNYEDIIFCCYDGEGIGPDEGMLLLLEGPITTGDWDFFDLEISSELIPLLLLIDASDTNCLSWLWFNDDFAEDDW